MAQKIPLHVKGQLFHNEIMNIDEAAEFLSLKVGTLYNLTSKKSIPFYKRRKRLYFLKQDLINWIMEGN